MEWKHLVEIASDIAGTVSGICLLLPVLDTSSLKKEVKSTRVALQRVAPSDAQGMQDSLRQLELATIAYSETEHRWLLAGAIALIVAFALRLLYHAM